MKRNNNAVDNDSEIMMKKKSKHKSNSILDRLLTKHYQFYAPLPLYKVMERLHEMSGEYKQYSVTSRIVVASESSGDDYSLTVNVMDNPGNSVGAYFTGTVYTMDDDGTQISGVIRLNTNLIGISLSLVAVAGVIAWLAQDTALTLFTLLVLMASPVYMLVKLFIKRRLLLQQLNAALTLTKSKSKPKQPPIDEYTHHDQL